MVAEKRTGTATKSEPGTEWGPDADAQAAAAAAAADRMRRATVFLTISLILLGIAWETVLAPLRPGGSLLVLKVLPLMLVLPAFWKGRIRHYQLWSMMILAYLCEGVVRGMSDGGRSAVLGWIAASLAAAIHLAILRYVMLRRRSAGSPATAR
jgi:uncharacterized membrane protein